MGTVVIVSGCPGAGKTTLARGLARASPRGLHLESDLFYGFPAHFVDPTRPESHAQNRAVLRAVGRAAGAFADEGYDVFVDGVVGPWFLPWVRGAVGSRHHQSYVLLDVALPLALERVRAREGPGESARVEHMHRAFGRGHGYARHRVETAEQDAQAVLRRVTAGLADGLYRL
jgi:predicted kinase